MAQRRGGTVRRLLGGVVAVGLLLGGGALVLALQHRAPAAEVRLPVHARGTVRTDAWALAGRAVVTSATPPRTRVLVDVVRRSGTGAVPRVVADFDGSGGGEAREVRCSGPASPRWHVPVGRAQRFVLTCDAFVEPWQLKALVYLPVRAE